MTNTYWIKVDVIRTTKNAALVSDSSVEAWVPLSVIIDSDDDIVLGKTVEIELPAWFAEKKGFVA